MFWALASGLVLGSGVAILVFEVMACCCFFGVGVSDLVLVV